MQLCLSIITYSRYFTVFPPKDKVCMYLDSSERNNTTICIKTKMFHLLLKYNKVETVGRSARLLAIYVFVVVLQTYLQRFNARVFYYLMLNIQTLASLKLLQARKLNLAYDSMVRYKEAYGRNLHSYSST